MSKLTKKIIKKGKLKLLSGLHIGASKESAQIGGVDSPIVRLKIKEREEPYIPGSSLKGKMRCLLEQRRGKELGGSDEVNDLFGFAGKKIISKLIVRDSMLTPESAEALKTNTNTDLPYSEVKFENTVDRFAGTATNPRQIERVPAGAEFDVEFVVNVWTDENDQDKEQKYLDLLEEGIDLLNNDYLGGNGTRGYGHIHLTLTEIKEV